MYVYYTFLVAHFMGMTNPVKNLAQLNHGCQDYFREVCSVKLKSSFWWSQHNPPFGVKPSLFSENENEMRTTTKRTKNNILSKVHSAVWMIISSLSLPSLSSSLSPSSVTDDSKVAIIGIVVSAYDRTINIDRKAKKLINNLVSCSFHTR